jgi:hypothetical protein
MSATSIVHGSEGRFRNRKLFKRRRNTHRPDVIEQKSFYKYEMIKFLSLLARSEGLSHDQFLQIWTAARAATLFTKSGPCRRYVQYGLYPDRVWPPGAPQLDLELDGIEEVRLEGQPEQAAEILKSIRTPAYLDNLNRYVGAMTAFVFEERQIVNSLPDDATGDGLLKRLVPLVRKGGWSHEQFIRHWVDVHAELLKDVEPGPRRYRQLYVNAEIPPPDGMPSLEVYIDGFSESWFVDEAEMNAGGETPAAKALTADNRVYLEYSKRFFYDEVEYSISPKGA